MSYFNKLLPFVENFNLSVKYSSIGYLTCAVLYTGCCCYKDSLKSLIIFRADNNTADLKPLIKANVDSEWTACKFGAYEHFGKLDIYLGI